MWAGFFHLVFLNVVIAFVEGTIVRGFVKAPTSRLMEAMMFANILSAGFGYLLMQYLGETFANWFISDPPVSGFIWFVGTVFLLMFAVSILIELPVLRLLMRVRKITVPARGAVAGLLTANLLSNAFVFLFFSWASVLSLPQGIKIVSAEEIARDPKAMLYWIDRENKINARQLVGGETSAIAKLVSRAYKRLDLHHDDQTRDVWLEAKTESSVAVARLGRVGRATLDESARDRLQGFSKRTGYSTIIDVQLNNLVTVEAENGDWWAGQGTTLYLAEELRKIRAPDDDNDAAVIKFAVEIPGYKHWSRTHVLLPDHQVILTLGDSICLYDIPTNRIALLAHGRGPVVAPSAWCVDSNDAASPDPSTESPVNAPPDKTAPASTS